MRVHRPLGAMLLIAAATLVAAPSAGAKEGVEATLATPIPLEAPAGQALTVVWSLAYVDELGERQPFNASNVFVRIRSAGGEAADEGFAAPGAHETGEYEATVVVPAGGVGVVEIGVRGWQTDAAGTRRSDWLFPIANGPVRHAAAAASEPSGSPPLVPFVAAGLLAAIALGAAVVAAARGRRGLRARRSASA